MRKMTVAVLIAALLLMLLAGVLGLGIAYAAAYLDTDGDGFFDPVPAEQVDACPTDPGVAPDGCPVPDGHDFSAASACEGVDITKSNFPNAIVNGASNTTFCIQDSDTPYVLSSGSGIKPPENARLIGEYSDGSAPVIDAGPALNGIRAQGRASLYLEGLEILGAEYIEEGCDPEPNCGRGVYPADNTTFKNVYIHDNENNGIGGGGGQTLLLENSTLDHNGNQDSARDDPANDAVSAANIKITQGTTVVIRDSVISNGFHDGAWCDVQCGGMTILSSTITGNYRGIHYEISPGPAEISGNIIQDNGHGTPMNPSTPAGLLLQNSQDVDIFNNDFGNNLNNAAYFANSKSRTPQMARVTFHDNRLNGDTLVGCTVLGVTCINNN